MATIRINRKREFINLFRNYKIFIDGLQVGKVSNGEIKEFEITEGKHIVTAKIDWCGSQKILLNFNSNETKELKIGGFKNGNWIMPLSLSILVIHFLLLLAFNFGYTAFLLIPTYLLLLYYLTFGHQKYLTLNERITEIV
jgi:hypothetical protein